MLQMKIICFWDVGLGRVRGKFNMHYLMMLPNQSAAKEDSNVDSILYSCIILISRKRPILRRQWLPYMMDDVETWKDLDS